MVKRNEANVKQDTYQVLKFAELTTTYCGSTPNCYFRGVTVSFRNSTLP